MSDNDAAASVHDEEEEPLPFEDDNDEEAGDDLDEDDTDFIPTDHPMFKRLNDDIKRQLSQQHDDLDVQIRDKAEFKRKLTDQRETVGVELYTFQQQLAKLHQRLQDANAAREAAEASRLEHERCLKEEREVLKQVEAELQHRTREYEAQRTELDKLNQTVLILEQKNQEIINKRQIAQRETYKSEQAATETEVSKQEQDMYIDRLTNQIEEVSSQIGVIENQILAQRGETKIARDALLQATLEMEKINFERNHLIQDWNSALLAVKQRSITLQQIDVAARKQEEEIMAAQNEEDGLKKQIQKQQHENEQKTLMLNKITNHLQFLDGKITQYAETRQKLQHQLDELIKMSAEKEVTVNRLLVERNAAKKAFEQSMKGANEISNQIFELEDKIIKHVTEQTKLKSETVFAQRLVEEIRSKVTEKDREMVNLENEIVRLKIDKLNISAQSDKLKRGLDEILAEMQKKDKVISQYEAQIRRNNVDIEKRQGEVDKLNKQYNSLKSDNDGEDYGPYEKHIKQLNQKIQECDEAAIESQSNWLKKQMELVSVEKSCEEMEDKNNTIQAKIAVLTRKRDRVKNQLEALEKEVQRIGVKIRDAQREMSKLGEKLSDSIDSKAGLTDGNINLEADILSNLAKLEEDAAKTETQIEEATAARENLAEDMMEVEKTIMMWEKKIQLGKEMREALDPNYGSQEIRTMKKEITRMELRLKQIKKQQLVIVQEMEYALNRRETIATKSQIKNRANKGRGRADVLNNIKNLQAEIKRLTSETARHDASLRENVEMQRELGTEIEQFAHMERETKQNRAEIEKQMHEEEKAKLANQSKLERLQQKQRYFTQKNVKSVIKSPESFEQAFGTLKQQETQLQSLIEMLSTEFPHLSENMQFIKDRVLTE